MCGGGGGIKYVCVCVCGRGVLCVCVCVCVCVVSVIVKHPVLLPCAVNGRSRNPLLFLFFMYSPSSPLPPEISVPASTFSETSRR